MGIRRLSEAPKKLSLNESMAANSHRPGRCNDLQEIPLSNQTDRDAKPQTKCETLNKQTLLREEHSSTKTGSLPMKSIVEPLAPCVSLVSTQGGKQPSIGGPYPTEASHVKAVQIYKQKTPFKHQETAQQAMAQVDNMLKIGKKQEQELNDPSRSFSQSPKARFQHPPKPDMGKSQKPKNPEFYKKEPDWLKGFDTAAYKHHLPDFDKATADYKSKFFDNLKLNKKNIAGQLVELVYLQIAEKCANHEATQGMPKIFEENQVLWGGNLMRSKQFQAVFAEFTNRIGTILETEFVKNGKMAKEYLKYPHQSYLANLAQRSHSVEQQMSGVWLPDKEPSDQKALQAKHNRAKKEIKGAKDAKKKEEEAKTENFKAKMQQAFSKKVHNKRMMLLMPVQEELISYFDSMMKKVDSIDQNNLECLKALPNKLLEFNANCVKSQDNNQKRMINKLTELDQEEQYLDTDKYRNDLWISLQTFEKNLKERTLGIEMDLFMERAQHQERTEGLKKQTGFYIEALESALAQVKLKLSRELDRSNMLLSEMESYMMNNHVDESQMDELDQRLEAMLAAEEEDQDTTGAKSYVPKSMQNDKKAKAQMVQMLKDLKKANESLKLDKKELKGQIAEIENEARKTKEFESRRISQMQQSKEMCRWYQDLVAKVIQRAKFFDRDAPSPAEDKEMYQELVDIRAQFLKEETDTQLAIKEGFMEPNDHRDINRLTQFADDSHAIMKMLKIPELFESYQAAIEDKGVMIDTMVTEMKKSGMIEDPVAKFERENPQLTQGKAGKFAMMKGNLGVGFAEKVANKITKGDDGGQEGHAWPKPNFTLIQKLTSKLTKPIQQVTADKIISKAKKNQAEIQKKLEKEQQKLEEEKKKKQEEEPGNMEKNKTNMSVSQEKPPPPKLDPEEEMRQERQRLKDKLEASKKVKEQEYKAEMASIEKMRAKQAIQDAKQAKKLEKEEKKNAKAAKRKQRQLEKASKPLSMMKTETNLPESSSDEDESSEESVASKEGFTMAEAFEKIEEIIKAKYEEIITQSSTSPSKTKANPDEEIAMGTRNLSNKHFEEIYATFKSALSVEKMDEDDYYSCFDSQTIEQCIDRMNSVHRKYLVESKMETKKTTKKPEKPAQEEIIKKGKAVPFTDCIMANIDEDSGELMGFTLRPQLVKLMYQRDTFEIGKVCRLVRTISQMNRMLMQQEKDLYLELEKERADPSVAETADTTKMVCEACKGTGSTFRMMPGQAQSSLTTIAGRTENQFNTFKKGASFRHTPNAMDRNNTAKSVQSNQKVKSKQDKERAEKAAEVLPDMDIKPKKSHFDNEKEVGPIHEDSSESSEKGHSKLLQRFVEVIREHVITILKREEPQDRNYYKVIWEDQTVEQLLEYKLPKVHKQLNPDDDPSLTHAISVFDYFQTLLSTLDTKLEMNMSVEEKFHLDVHKWVWAGDNIEDDEREDSGEDRAEDDDSEGGYIEPMTLGTVSHSKVSSKQVSRSRKQTSTNSKTKSLLVPSTKTPRHSDQQLTQPQVMHTQTTPMTDEKGESLQQMESIDEVLNLGSNRQASSMVDQSINITVQNGKSTVPPSTFQQSTIKPNTSKGASTVIDRSKADSTVMDQSSRISHRRKMQPTTRQAESHLAQQITSSNQNPLTVDTVAGMTDPRMDTAPNEVFVEDRGVQTLPVNIIQDDNSTPRKTVYGRNQPTLKSTTSQTPEDFLPQQNAQQNVSSMNNYPVFRNEDVTIHIDHVFGKEIDNTIMTLMEFVNMTKVNKKLAAEEGARHVLPLLGQKDKMSVIMKGKYIGKSNDYKSPEEEIKAQKAHRQEILKVLRKDIKGTVGFVKEEIGERTQRLSALQNRRTHGSQSGSSSGHKGSSGNYSPSQSRYDHLYEQQTPHLPILDFIENRQKFGLNLNYESEDQLIPSTATKKQQNPFKQVSHRVVGVHQDKMFKKERHSLQPNKVPSKLQMLNIASENFPIGLAINSPGRGSEQDDIGRRTFFCNNENQSNSQMNSPTVADTTGYQSLNIQNFPSIKQAMTTTASNNQIWRDLPHFKKKNKRSENNFSPPPVPKTQSALQGATHLFTNAAFKTKIDHKDVSGWLRKTSINKAEQVQQDGTFVKYKLKTLQQSPRHITAHAFANHTASSSIGMPGMSIKVSDADLATSHYDRYLKPDDSRHSTKDNSRINHPDLITKRNSIHHSTTQNNFYQGRNPNIIGIREENRSRSRPKSISK